MSSYDEESKAVHNFTAKYLENYTFACYHPNKWRYIRGTIDVVTGENFQQYAHYSLFPGDSDMARGIGAGTDPAGAAYGWPHDNNYKTYYDVRDNRFPFGMQGHPEDDPPGWWIGRKYSYGGSSVYGMDISAGGELFTDFNRTDNHIMQYGGLTRRKGHYYYPRYHTDESAEGTYFKECYPYHSFPKLDWDQGWYDGRRSHVDAIRGMHMFTPVHNPHDWGTKRMLYPDYFRTITYVAVGLPAFDRNGFLSQADFQHMVNYELCGRGGDPDAERSGHASAEGDTWKRLTPKELGPGLAAEGYTATWTDMGASRISNTLADNPISFTLPCNKNMASFIEYMEGVPGTDQRYVTTEFEEGDIEGYEDITNMNPILQGLMLVKAEDRRLNYVMDPSSVPYAQFNAHYDHFENGFPGVLGGASAWAERMQASYASTYDYTRSEYYSVVHPAAPSLAYNLELCQGGRLPPIVSMAPGEWKDHNSRGTIYAATHIPGTDYASAYDLTVGDDWMWRNTYRYSMARKNLTPVPYDGRKHIFDYGHPEARPYSTGHRPFTNISAYGESYQILMDITDPENQHSGAGYYHKKFLEDGIFYMYWRDDVFTRQDFHKAVNARVKNSLQIFYGNDKFNLFNAFNMIKNTVDGLYNTWVYDPQPAETRIRMQKAATYQDIGFSSLQPGLTNIQYESDSSLIELQDEEISELDLGTDVQPDDIDDIGRAMFGGDTDY